MKALEESNSFTLYDDIAAIQVKGELQLKSKDGFPFLTTFFHVFLLVFFFLFSSPSFNSC